jgi:hypothetical protein
MRVEGVVVVVRWWMVVGSVEGALPAAVARWRVEVMQDHA